MQTGEQFSPNTKWGEILWLLLMRCRKARRSSEMFNDSPPTFSITFRRLQGKNFCIVYYLCTCDYLGQDSWAKEICNFHRGPGCLFNLQTTEFLFSIRLPFMDGLILYREFNRRGTHFPNCACHDIWILWHYDISIIIRRFQRIKRTKKVYWLCCYFLRK